MKLKRTNSNDPEFTLLVSFLDDELMSRYGEEQLIYRKYNTIISLPTVVIAYVDNKPVGCGCFKNFEGKTVELKRMFVYNNHRGKGIGTAILKELEEWAKELSYENLVLETAAKQPEAIHLYKKNGYDIIPNYGQYKDMALSICMKKKLS